MKVKLVKFIDMPKGTRQIDSFCDSYSSFVIKKPSSILYLTQESDKLQDSYSENDFIEILNDELDLLVKIRGGKK